MMMSPALHLTSSHIDGWQVRDSCDVSLPPSAHALRGLFSSLEIVNKITHMHMRMHMHSHKHEYRYQGYWCRYYHYHQQHQQTRKDDIY